MPDAFSISGSTGIVAATVAYSGAATGSVTADGSGNFTIVGLVAGDYLIVPSFAGYAFTPESQPETIVDADIAGVNFVADPLPPAPLTSRVRTSHCRTVITSS